MSKIKAIEEYGQLYVEKFLKQQLASKDDIYNDPYEAVRFLFAKVFYRGRKDELSERFMNATLKTLDEHKPNKDYEHELLDEQLKANGVNNSRDRRMVLEVINWIFNSLDAYKNNVVNYTVSQIKTGKVEDVFRTLNGIYAIGDKLASFYLRDVVIIYQLEKYLKPDELKYCQPIDTWVKKVAIKVGVITPKDTQIEDIKSAIIKSCLDIGVSPLLFNAGAWMAGAKSFDLLIESL